MSSLVQNSQGGIIHASSHYRLHGYLCGRLKRSGFTWVKVNVKDFCSLTGCSRRTFFYAKKRLEGWRDSKITFRTALKQRGRGWELYCSYVRSQFFSHTRQGRDRRARDRISATGCNPFKGNTTYSRNITPTVRALGLSPPEIRLAHRIKRVLEYEHWDNCKVRYSAGMAFNFAKWGIALSQDSSVLVGDYAKALEEMHREATDCGLVFSPSSTVHRARKRVCLKAGVR